MSELPTVGRASRIRARVLNSWGAGSRIGPLSVPRLIGRARSDAKRKKTAEPVQCYVDTFDNTFIDGWAIHPGGIRQIRVFCNDVPIGCAEIGLERRDVREAYPEIAGSDRSGFRFLLEGHLREGISEVALEIESMDGTLARTSKQIAKVGAEGRYTPHGFRAGVDLPIRSGFPFEVTGLLRAFRPGHYEVESSWTDDLMARAVDDLKILWYSGNRSPALNRYILFLKTMDHRFRWVGSMFPKYNNRSAVGSKDAACALTCSPEMLAIANQLYVLKSNGLEGHFLEFGCFKGYSSCCLSYSCNQLGIPMEIFDSFAGLPPSDSDFYSAGEFCGTLAEVSSHIEEFGDPRVVNFHKGYFADTLHHLDKQPVICIWMDVDLLSSARDVAQIFDWLPRTSVVFTHEFPSIGEQGGRIIPEISEVFPPILDRFASLGRTPVGRHLHQALGAIWDASEGIPVIPQNCLMDLVNLGE
jgi:O-methyltransferase